MKFTCTTGFFVNLCMHKFAMISTVYGLFSFLQSFAVEDSHGARFVRFDLLYFVSFGLVLCVFVNLHFIGIITLDLAAVSPVVVDLEFSLHLLNERLPYI
jgi:hypothetical protein